jgi:hypothetical protein
MARHYQQQETEHSPSDVEQLLQIAQLQQLLQQPNLQEQQLDRQTQADRTTAAIHLLGLMQEREMGQQKLDEATKTREMAVKGNVTDALISHLTQRPDVPLSTLAETLAQSGYPELGGALSKVHLQDVQKRAATHLAAINALQKSSPDAVAKYIPAVQADPEVWNAIKDQIPGNVAPVDTTTTGTKLGRTTKNVLDVSSQSLGNPLLAAALIGGRISDKMKKPSNSAYSDFFNALLNQPSTP